MSTGTRKNNGKLRWRNFPLFLIEPLIEVAAKGEEKYDTFNFLKGLYVNDCLDSAKRHMMKFESPYEPDNDEETGLSHAVHCAWNMLIIAYVLRYRPDLDDRWRPPEKEKDASPKE